MLVFLDFEASSLSKVSYPIEVGWIFEDGRTGEFLIRPAPQWTDWSEEAAGIHGIDREALTRDGVPLEDVAQTMLEVLSGHDLVASAPSWDGKWLSTLLRAAGQPRHALRLRATEEVLRECALALLAPHMSAEALSSAVDRVLAQSSRPQTEKPAHRALADAIAERDRWLTVRQVAKAVIEEDRRAHG